MLHDFTIAHKSWGGYSDTLDLVTIFVIHNQMTETNGLWNFKITDKYFVSGISWLQRSPVIKCHFWPARGLCDYPSMAPFMMGEMKNWYFDSKIAAPCIFKDSNLFLQNMKKNLTSEGKYSCFTIFLIVTRWKFKHPTSSQFLFNPKSDD